MPLKPETLVYINRLENRLEVTVQEIQNILKFECRNAVPNFGIKSIFNVYLIDLVVTCRMVLVL